MSLKKNVVANLAGSAWSALMALAFVPFFIKLMGVESYGIVGVFTSLVGMLAILDLGLSQSMNREMARLSTDSSNAKRMVDTARTLEVIYWAIALGVVAIITLLANFLAYNWLNPQHLSRESLQQALWIIALVIGLRWPVALYTGGLNGLQRQVLVNKLLAVFNTLQGAGALAALWFIEPTVQVFFVWQALIALVQVLTLRIALRHSFSTAEKGEFSKEVLRNLWRFAAGMTSISFVATILTQLDKILLSKMLTLTEFGYYTFAATIAAVVYKIIEPVFTAYYPRLTELVSEGDHSGLVETYHHGCQLMTVVLLPGSLMLAFFSHDVLELWTRNSDISAHSSLLVSLLVVGNALHGLMHIPYALQLAYGWTKFAFYQNIMAVIVLVPAIYFATLYWGALGAAAVWIVLNCGYVFISIQLMHRRLLVKEKLNWYENDVGKPLLVALFVVSAGRMVMVNGTVDFYKLVTLILVFGLATVAAAVSIEGVRDRIRAYNNQGL